MISWLFTHAQRGRGVELGTTENRQQWGGGFEPGTSRFQIQRPKPLGHAENSRITDDFRFTFMSGGKLEYQDNGSL